jgi:hypothetical protein
LKSSRSGFKYGFGIIYQSTKYSENGVCMVQDGLWVR